jgi:hypothetical protein
MNQEGERNRAGYEVRQPSERRPLGARRRGETCNADVGKLEALLRHSDEPDNMRGPLRESYFDHLPRGLIL